MTSQTIPIENNGSIVSELAAKIIAQKDYLSEIDGKIGDGDHGVNMAKGFGRAADRISADTNFSEALSTLSSVLMGEIGGSMGPLYGVMFQEMSDSLGELTDIDQQAFGDLLVAGRRAVSEIGGAKIGDKTLMDVLIPAVDAYEEQRAAGSDFSECLHKMTNAATAGRDSTVELTAKIGRASRLGDRSKGVLDAGAASCCIILHGLADGISARLSETV